MRRVRLATAALAAAAAAAAAAPGAAVTQLAVEGHPVPVLLVDAAAPRFSWAVVNASGGATQAAYRLVVGGSLSLMPLYWDSGVVAGAAASQVPYGGPPLPSDADVYFRVDALLSSTGAGAAGGGGSTAAAPSSWVNSSVASFSTGLPYPSGWGGAAWIGGWGQMRAQFALPPGATVTRARAYVSAMGLFELWVNGQRADGTRPGGGDPRAHLAPGFAAVFSSRQRYVAVDVAHLLTTTAGGGSGGGANNAVGLRVGSGKWGVYTEYCPDGPRACDAAILALSVTTAPTGGGPPQTQLVAVTNGRDWTGADGPVVFQNLFWGEHRDGRLEQPGWATPGFANASAWGPVAVRLPAPTLALSALAAPPIAGWEVAPAVNVTALPGRGPGGGVSYAVDTGLNAAGTFTLALPAGTPSGTNVSVHLTERLAGDGVTPVNTFPCPAPCCPAGGGCSSMAFSLVAAGSGGRTGREVLAPAFSSGGFRYARIDGWPAGAPPPAPADFTVIRISSAGAPTGGAAFGRAVTAAYSSLPPSAVAAGDVLNAVGAAVVNSLRSNLMSHPTDCPHRERRGWGGDAAVSVHAALLLLGGGPSGLTGLYEQLLDVGAETLALGCATAMGANNTCGVFHEGGRGSGSSSDTWAAAAAAADAAVPAVPAAAGARVGNGPGQRPDCWLCCAAKAGFGCIDKTTAVAGALPDIIPVNGPSRSFPGSITWTQVVLAVADALLQTHGPGPADGGPLAGAYDGLLAPHLAWVNAAAAGTRNGTYPLEFYGDWEAPEPSTPLFMAQIAYASMLGWGAGVAASLGRAHDAEAYLTLLSALNGVLADAYLAVNASTGLRSWDTGSQAAQAGALWAGLGGPAGAAAAGDVAATLVANVAARGSHLSVGTLGSRFLLQALTATGHGGVALDLATQTTAPGWGAMVTQPPPPGDGNATSSGPFRPLGTLWESWTPAPGSSTSLNHAMFGGGIGEWLVEGGSGLRVRHRPAAPPVPLSLQQAACRARLGLHTDVVAVYGVAPARLCLMADAAAAARAALPWTGASGSDGHPPLHLASIRARLAEAAAAAGLPPAPAAGPRWAPVVQVLLEAPLVARLRAAEGHVAMPYGRATVQWAFTPPRAGGSGSDRPPPLLSLTVDAPHPAPVAVDLPLPALLAAAGGAEGGADVPALAWRLSVMQAGSTAASDGVALACVPAPQPLVVLGGGSPSPPLRLELCGGAAATSVVAAAGWRSRLSVYERVDVTPGGAAAAASTACDGGDCEFIRVALPHGRWALELAPASVG
jgi:hypothetical protein